MLPKSQRLRTVDFKNLRQARVVHTPHLLLRLFSIPSGKAAVVVSSSNYKKAVDRNLLRRRVYHMIATHSSLLRGRTITATLKKGALSASYRELESEFLKALTA